MLGTLCSPVSFEFAALVDAARYHQVDALCLGVWLLVVAVVAWGRALCTRRGRICTALFVLLRRLLAVLVDWLKDRMLLI